VTNSKPENLQQFADRHGLRVKHYAIHGPRGKIWQAYAGWYYVKDLGFKNGLPLIEEHKFNPVSQAKQAIEAIGLQYTAPAEPIKKDRRALLIVKRSDGWYVADKAGPFKTRESARTAREKLRSSQ
jgi:hypothetical protein